MVWLIGIIGLIGGFAFGLHVIKHLLAGKPREDLLNDKSIKTKYGSIVWLISVVTCIISIYIYKIIIEHI